MPIPESSSLESEIVSTTPCPQRIYSVGTLTYTLRGVCILFAWLLGGQFVFDFFENILGRFLPLYLNDLHASNALIGSMGSISGGVSLFLGPHVSLWSDSARTRWGRRIPFLAVATPLAVLTLIMIGFSTEVGDWLHDRVVFHIAPAVSATTVILAIVCVFVAFFYVFNMVLCCVFSWLLRDVVPQELIARIMSSFRIVSTLSTLVFNHYVFPYILIYRKEVFVGVGLFYTATFLVMCLKVKEGEYPPPPARQKSTGILMFFVIFMRDCLSVSIYRKYALVKVLGSIGSCSGIFTILFYRNNLHMTMQDMEKIFSVGLLMGGVANLPMGWLCDKINPFRIAIFSLSIIFVIYITAFFYIKDFKTMMVINVVLSFICSGWGIGCLSMDMRLYPSEKFGQFSTATNLIGTVFGIIGSYLAGWFMDFMHGEYIWGYLWGAFGCLAIFPLILVYRDWLKYGGPDNYQAPLPPTDS